MIAKRFRIIIGASIRSLKTLLAPLLLGGVGGGLFLSSCGEFWEFESQQVATADAMTLGRKVINLMVGDSCVVPVNFVPKSQSSYTVFWLTDDEEICRFKGDTLVAVAEGQTRAIAFTSIDRLRDTCYVNVIPAFEDVTADYPYDMMVYADVDIHGEKLTSQNSCRHQIAAYVGDEMRGLGVVREFTAAKNKISYLELRVWSPFSYGDKVTFRCYYRGTGRMELFPDTITFDGEMHGTLSDLYPLRLDEKAREYIPDFDYEFYIENPDTIKVVIEEE